MLAKHKYFMKNKTKNYPKGRISHTHEHTHTQRGQTENVLADHPSKQSSLTEVFM